MLRKTFPFILSGLFLVGLSVPVYAQTNTKIEEMQEQQIDQIQKMRQTQQTLQVAQSFLEAAGAGDIETLNALMADNFVWHNEGDKSVPWIGTWEGKETVLNQFLPIFGGGLKTTSWTTDYSFAKDDQAVFMGSMAAEATNTGASTGPMNWAVRVQVVDGKVKSWNWFEDSFAVSRAFHGQ